MKRREHKYMIAKGRYVKGNQDIARAKLVSHLKYIEYRSRKLFLESRNDRRIFDKGNNVVNRRDAVNDMMQHTRVKINYYKIVLSPEDEPVQDWREWTRHVMGDLEKAQGKELHWYAVYHQNTDHPHVHIVVAGSGYDSKTGREEPVKLYAEDYELLRVSGRAFSDYCFHRFLEDQFQALDARDRAIEQEFEQHPERAAIHPLGDKER